MNSPETQGGASKKPAEEIDLDIKRNEFANDLSQQSDSEVIGRTLSRATHPSVATDSQRAASQLNHMIGHQERDDLSEQDRKWRGRTRELMLEVDDLSDEALDDLLAHDPVLAQMYEWLRNTREQAKDLSEERSAVLALRGLRASVVERQSLEELRDDGHWQRLMEVLGVAEPK